MRDNSDKFWMIINIKHEIEHPFGNAVPPERAPKFLHYDKDKAEIELLRLQEKYADEWFVLLEAMSTAEKNTGGLLHVEQIGD